MFNPQFDEARQMLKFIQEQSEPMALQLNAHNTKINGGGPGLDAETTHMLIGSLVANTHNLAMAVGQIIDYLDEQHRPTT